MLNISKVNNSVLVEGLDNIHFPDNGRLSVPLNSIILVLDESDFVTFRSSSSNNVYFSANINQIRIAGASVTKQTIISAFDAVANAATGGGGGDYSELEAKINQEILDRTNADLGLAQLIDDEKTARQNGDSSLQTQISGISNNAVSASVSGSTLVIDRLS